MKNVFKRMTLVALLSVLLISLGFAQGGSDRPKVRQVMNQVLSSFIKLIPYMNEEMKFTDPNNKKLILGHMVNLRQSFKNNKHLKTFYVPGFRPSFDTVLNHMDKTISSFEAGNVLFARTRLNATTNLCISCHSQLKNKGKGFLGSISKINKNSFKSSLEYADYLFLVRNYRKSVRYYEMAINERIKTNKELVKTSKMLSENSGYMDRSISRALKRIMTVYTKVFFDVEKASSYVDKYVNNKGLSKSIRMDLKSWKEQLKPWFSVDPKTKIKNEKDMRLFIKKYLKNKDGSDKIAADGSEDISMLISSGILFNFLNHGPEESLIPELYYWLSKIERSLNFNFFYSLADVYLKECILNFSKVPFAKKCYDQYAEDVKNDFTGSSGTDIPADMKAELKMLKGKLGK